MEQYLVTGMSCASCQAHVEKAVSKVPGVTNVAVSLLTNSMSVEGTASSSDIIKAVEKAGYGAKLKNDASADQAGQKSSSSLAGSLAAEEEALEDHETPVLKKRLISSVVLLVILMYFSMGASMWGWPVPAFIDNPFAFGVIEMFLAMLVMFIGYVIVNIERYVMMLAHIEIEPVLKESDSSEQEKSAGKTGR